MIPPRLELAHRRTRRQNFLGERRRRRGHINLNRGTTGGRQRTANGGEHDQPATRVDRRTNGDNQIFSNGIE
jgi:hypothetical protein